MISLKSLILIILAMIASSNGRTFSNYTNFIITTNHRYSPCLGIISHLKIENCKSVCDNSIIMMVLPASDSKTKFLLNQYATQDTNCTATPAYSDHFTCPNVYDPTFRSGVGVTFFGANCVPDDEFPQFSQSDSFDSSDSSDSSDSVILGVNFAIFILISILLLSF
ncbi:hypothetical protein ACTFIU_003256 [Dictyostelium citrinum]